MAEHTPSQLAQHEPRCSENASRSTCSTFLSPLGWVLIEKTKSDDLNLWYVLSFAWNSFYKAAFRGTFKSWQEACYQGWMQMLLWAELVCNMVAPAACALSSRMEELPAPSPVNPHLVTLSLCACPENHCFSWDLFFSTFLSECGNTCVRLTSFIQHFVNLCAHSLVKEG